MHLLDNSFVTIESKDFSFKKLMTVIMSKIDTFLLSQWFACVNLALFHCQF